MTVSIPTIDGHLVTPLYQEHRRLGARIIEFAGWLMPVQYEGIIAEHTAVRTSAGCFDLSHMGRLRFRGPHAFAFAQYLTTNNVETLGPGQAQYTLFCNEAGRILDDAVLYRLHEELLIVVNAANRPKVLHWIHQHQAGFDVEVEDQTGSLALLGLQGPESEPIVQTIAEADLSALPYYSMLETEVGGVPGMVARTGYTGEDGFEVFVDSGQVERIWRLLLHPPTPVQPVPAGLGARDTLRLEAGMPLYGHEISEDTDPFEARLGRVVKLDKGQFIGREALALAREAGPKRRLVGFEMLENGVPRQGYPVVDGSRPIGQVTSGTFSPTLRKSIGMAYVPVEYSEPGTPFQVVVRERPLQARVVPLPFVAHRTKKDIRARTK